MEELIKERQEILQERKELDKKAAQHDELVYENKALKEKLLYHLTDSQSGTSISTDPQSLLDDSQRNSDKNELDRMKRKYKNLESHNTKLKIQLQQQQQDVEKQTKEMSEVKMQLQQKEEETKLISELNEQVKVNMLYHTFYIHST